MPPTNSNGATNSSNTDHPKLPTNNKVNAVLVILCLCQAAFLVSEKKLTKSLLYQTVVEESGNPSGNDSINGIIGSSTGSSSRSSSSTGSRSSLTSSRSYHPQNQKRKSPNWMVAVDCASYDISCTSYHVAAQRYAPYPFPFVYGVNASEFELLTNRSLVPSWLTQPLQPFVPRHEALTLPPTPVTQQDLHSYYTLNKQPPEVPKEEYLSCVAAGMNTPYEQQLDTVLRSLEVYTSHGLFEGTSKDNTNNTQLVAFTISDAKYVYDMIHSFFQMSWDLITRHHNSLFMVALDHEVLRTACRYGYPVVLVNPDASNDTSTKTMVQNTKFLLSRDVAERGYNYLFYEMDVWWIQSPLDAIRQTIQHRRTQPEYGMDLIVSGHQDNPSAPNIGFYAVQSNERTREFFRELYQLICLRPTVFDQFAFVELYNTEKDAVIFKNDPERLDALLSGNFTHKGWETELAKPKLKFLMKNQAILDGSFIAAHPWPIIHERTLAVHVLCEAPLRSPNGKKILAKELGAWYGYRSTISPRQKEGDIGENEAGYYTRTGRQNRRYLMLDGKAWMSHDTNEQVDLDWGFYHRSDSLQLTIAILVAIARQTNRILILPKIFHDRGATFLWIGLDLQTLEGVVEFRETNFINNPKAWFRDDQPFESYARTALGTTTRNSDEIKLYGQAKTTAEDEGTAKIEKWRFPRALNHLGIHFIDAWLQLMTSSGYDDAELLLVNPQFLYDRNRNPELGDHKHASPILREIWKLYAETIKWCTRDDSNNIWETLVDIWPAGRARAQDDCYGRGQLVKGG